jgi:hypothetical protein
VGGSGRWAAPAVISLPRAPGAWLALLPPEFGSELPKWTVSRVLFRLSVTREPARIIHLGGALLRRSSTLTRTLAAAPCGALASGGSPSTASLFELAPGGACPAAGHPADARGLLPHDFNLTCASKRTVRCADQRPSAVWFLLRFPSGRPGSPLTTSLPYGARTFLPRTVVVRRRSSIHLRRPGAYRSTRGRGKRSVFHGRRRRSRSRVIRCAP